MFNPFPVKIAFSFPEIDYIKWHDMTWIKKILIIINIPGHQHVTPVVFHTWYKHIIVPFKNTNHQKVAMNQLVLAGLTLVICLIIPDVMGDGYGHGHGYGHSSHGIGTVWTSCQSVITMRIKSNLTLIGLKI